MPAPVFISYARQASGEKARALRDALGADTCFLDVEDLDTGDLFPRALTDALLSSRVFVAFVDGQYFRRWYCLREWLLARAAFDAAQQRGVGDPDTLAHVVIALGEGLDDKTLVHLPPLLQSTNWPAGSATVTLAGLVRAKLASVANTLAARMDRFGVPPAQREAMVTEAAIPGARNLAGLRMFPVELPASLGTRFVGRVQDLWRLHATLTEPLMDAPHVAAIMGALQGGGGFGKTQLAREYVHRLGPSHYPGGCFWIDAGGGLPLEHQFHGVLRTLRPDTLPLETMRERGDDVRAILATTIHTDPGAASMLFVVDNVPEPVPGQPPAPLETWCPGLGKVTCLATSRKKFEAFLTVECLDVDVLDSIAATALLTDRVSRTQDLTGAQWLRVADWVGRLPLALTLLNASLRAGALLPVELLGYAQQEETTSVLDEQRAALRGTVPEGALRGVTEAFASSFARLSVDAQQLALKIAWLGASPLPDELLSALAPSPTRVAPRVMLIDRSFLTEARLPGTAVGLGWQMHRVLADFIRSRTDRPLDEIGTGLAALRSVVAPLDWDVPLARERGLVLLEHAASLVSQLERRHATLADHWAALAPDVEAVAQALLLLGERSGDRRPLQIAVRGFRMGTELYSREDLPLDWARAQNDLGIALGLLGLREAGTGRLREAVAAYRAALEERTRERVPRDWGITLNDLGNALGELGAREPGTDWLLEAVAVYREALKERPRERVPRDWAKTQNNLGNVLHSLGERAAGTERLREAVAAYRAALEEMTREHVPFDWASTQNNLGITLRALGERETGTARLTEAVAACRAALEVWPRERLPLGWGITQDTLAEALTSLGEREAGAERLREAVVAARTALEVFESNRADAYVAIAKKTLDRAESLLRAREEL